MTSLVTVENLVKHFPIRGGLLQRVVAQVQAVNGVSFKVQKAKTYGLVGESGCGKSTLGRAVLRLHEPTSGTVTIAGRDLLALNVADLRAMRREAQIIFQDPYASLNPRMTVHEILMEPLDTHTMGSQSDRAGRVLEILELVGMRENALDRYPHEFSGGQRQRIGIARALVLGPSFIVADEPVSALDVSVRSQVLNLIRSLQDTLGIAFLFISHDLAVVQHVSHEVGVMYLGRLVEEGPTDKLYARPLHPYTQALLSAVPQPDPNARSHRTILVGDAPSPITPPSGCPFHPRCPKAMPRCKIEVPVRRDMGAGHSVSCHLY